MTNTTFPITRDAEALTAVLRDYYAMAFQRFDALMASFLLGYVSLYLLSLTVTSSGLEMWFALIATVLTTAGCLYSQVVWANAN